MKKSISYLIIIITFCLGCKKVDNTTGITPITPFTPIKKDKISGLVQKGPYINGTQIILYVLDDKLAQTGKVFNTQITDNKGSFELNNVELSSKYVQLSANGYYFNESSNAITISQLQLNALTDITDASTININILTHLEKRRVEYLVKGGKTFTEAKKTAQQEILAIFGISLTQSAVSEKLDIAAAGDANAVLLAVSLMIQGKLSVGDLSELLATISADLEEDGLITNAGVLTTLISNAKSLHLDLIRQNIVKRYQDLAVNATIPDFEKYINAFQNQSAQEPSVEIKSAKLFNHSAILNGVVNPNGAKTVVTFEYGLTTAYGLSVLAIESPLYGDIASNVTAQITNLDSLTNYHCRIKAENSKGVTYSPDSIITTINSGIVFIDIDGNKYGSVVYGKHEWVSSNLNVSRYRNGDIIQRIDDPQEWANATNGAYCYYNNDSATYAEIYGKLYNWYAVNDPRGLAPTGWHVASDEEWYTLTDLIGIQSQEIKNVNGFNAVPSGYRNAIGTTGNNFIYMRLVSFWWTSSEVDINGASFRNLSYSDGTVGIGGYAEKKHGMSVRCVRD